jgi:hypothetical protein
MGKYCDQGQAWGRLTRSKNWSAFQVNVIKTAPTPHVQVSAPYHGPASRPDFSLGNLTATEHCNRAFKIKSADKRLVAIFKPLISATISKLEMGSYLNWKGWRGMLRKHQFLRRSY